MQKIYSLFKGRLLFCHCHRTRKKVLTNDPASLKCKIVFTRESAHTQKKNGATF